MTVKLGKNRWVLGLALMMIGVGLVAANAVAEDTAGQADPETAPSEVQVELVPQVQAEPAPEPAAKAEPEPGAVQDSMSPSLAATSPGNVTVDFKDADIQNVLRIISYKAGVNIVAGKDVTGSVTIRLVDVPWEKALDMVLKTYGYAYDRDGNVIRVTTLENLQREELATEVFVLNYSLASDVEKALKDVLSERGKVRSDLRSNMLIVTDMPTTVAQIRKVIERLDKSTPQVLIQTKVIETALGDADRMGIKWSDKIKVTGAQMPHTFPFPSVQRSAQWLRNYQPVGRVSTATTTDSALTSTTTADFPATDVARQPTFPVADKDEYKFGTLDFSEFSALLEFIEEKTDSKVLSEPHVTTLNNQQAKILVGEVIAIPTFERNGTTGRMEITGYKDRDLGIRLTVTPQVNDQNEVVVTIHPEITTLIGYDELTPDIKAPRFSTREAMTQIRVKSGQTIAIGGLIKEETVDQTTKVPILGDIPLVGNAFKYSNKTVQKSDLLFFMTVNVVKDDALPQGHKL